MTTCTPTNSTTGGESCNAIVSEWQIVRAMMFFERKHIAAFGPLDGVNLPVAVSQLADLLGVLWFEKETSAKVKTDSKVAALLLESGQTLVEA